MNRKERRARGIKNHDPAVMVKNSEMRSHIHSLLKNDPDVQKAIQEEVRVANLEEAKKQDLDILTLILFTLHRSEKYGRIRLLRYAKTLTVLKDYYEGRYEDCDMFAMRQHLKEETGIDVEHLDEEVEKFATEESANKR